jgi:CHAT domain-containing protein
MRRGSRLLATLAALLMSDTALALEVAAVGAGWKADPQAPQVADRLIGWIDEHDRPVAIDDPFEWLVLEQDRAGAGALRVRVMRAGTESEQRLPAPNWDWQLAASANEADADWHTDWTRLQQALAAIRASDWPAAYTVAEDLVQRRPTEADRIRLQLFRALEADPDRRRWLRLAQALDADLTARDIGGVRGAQGAVARARALLLLRDYDGAEAAVADALARLGSATRHALLAQALELRGSIAYRRADNAAALADFERAAELLGELAPDSLAHAQAQGKIAAVALSRGEFAAADTLFGQAIDSATRAAPGSLALGRLHFNAGLGAFQRRRLAAAQMHAQTALALFEAAGPGTPEVAMARSQLAEVLSKRGEEASAEPLKRAALAQAQALSPDSFETLSIRMELAYSLRWQQRGDEARAQIAAVLEHDDPARVETLFLDARQLRAQLDLEAGDALRARSELIAILPGYRSRQRELPVAQSLLMLTAAERALGNPDAASATQDEALAIIQRIAPDTAIEAEAHLEGARLLRARDQVDAALASYRRAQQCLERQRDYLGGDEESRARWAARYQVYYREPAQWLLELERPGEAWEQIERSRAREFLAALGERQQALIDALPAALRERADRLAEDYLRALKQAAAGTAAAPPDAALADWQDQVATLEPRLARLAQPAAAADVAKSLPAASVLVSYLVTESHSYALVLRPSDVVPQLRRLPSGQAQLAAEVDALRLLIARPDAAPESQAALLQRALDLHKQLIAPLADLLADAQHLLIVADGPLLQLPFAALVSAIDTEGQPRWLVQDRAPTMLSSASAWLQAHQLPRLPTRLELTALAAAPVGAAAGTLREGDSATDLPGAREEARQISALFGKRVRLQIDADATIEAARAALADSRRTHFASHAVLDPRDPLAAWLQLSPAGGDDGRLRAIDLMRGPPLHSHLVTLSACDTAGGAALGDEGLLGLARAFQYAGVPTVVGTRWRVSDRPTQALMQAFYSELAQAADADLALQAAQRQLIEQRPGWWQRWWRRAPDLSHPWYWAGFVVVGTSSGATRESD